VGGACLPTGASRGGTQARCLKRQLSLPVSSPTRVPRNTGFPPMTLPFNRSLVGARVKRISSARAPEMCPFSKTIRENQTVRETFQGFANPTGQRPGAQVPVPPQLPCVRCWRWPRRCWRARSPIAAASTTRPSTVFRVGPPCSGQQRTGTPALGKPRSVVLLMGDRGFESTSLHRRVQCEPRFSGAKYESAPNPGPVFASIVIGRKAKARTLEGARPVLPEIEHERPSADLDHAPWRLPIRAPAPSSACATPDWLAIPDASPVPCHPLPRFRPPRKRRRHAPDRRCPVLVVGFLWRFLACSSVGGSRERHGQRGGGGSA